MEGTVRKVLTLCKVKLNFYRSHIKALGKQVLNTEKSQSDPRGVYNSGDAFWEI